MVGSKLKLRSSRAEKKSVRQEQTRLEVFDPFKPC